MDRKERMSINCSLKIHYKGQGYSFSYHFHLLNFPSGRKASCDFEGATLRAYMESRSQRCKWWTLKDKEMSFPDPTSWKVLLP